MAIAKVQSVTATSSPATIASTGTGNVLVVFLSKLGFSTITNPTAAGVTFTKANPTEVDIGTTSAGKYSMFCYFATNIPSAVTSVAFVADVAVIYEFSGLGTAPTLHGESDNNFSGTTNGSLSLTVTSTGGSGDLGFLAFRSNTTAGLAGATVTAISDATNSWNGASGVDVNFTNGGNARVATTWSILTAAIGGTVTFTETALTYKGAIAFALSVTGGAATVFTRQQRGWGF